MNSVRNAVFLRIWLIVSIVCCFSGSVGSTQTEVWTLSSFEELNRGEFENVSLMKTGEIMLASQTEQLAVMEQQQAMYVWALANDSKGNLYLGTGEQGRIFKISPEGEMSLFFDSPEIGIMSLAVDAEDNVYAGSAPDGLVYKITPKGSQTTLYSTGEHYVWSLVFDANGILYAGTGGEGKIFQILPNGAGTVLYDSPQSHVMSLVYDIGGWLYAGTEGKGITYKIGLDGTAFALYDAEEQEVHALTLDSQGNLYIAAISSEFFAQAQPPPGQGEQPESRPKEKVSKQSTIYRISPAGTVEKIVELPEALIYTMITDTNDDLLAGTDEKGRIYRVVPEERTYHQVLMIETGNILALLRDAKGEIYIGTGDTGAAYRLSSQLATQGSYLSPIYDSKVTATWGKVFWRGTLNQIALSTRTGNTAVPDDTWSTWSEELGNAEGSPIPNPPARFIQWKATLAISEEAQQPAELEEVSVAFLPHNLPPEIQQVGVFYPTQNNQADQSNASGNNSKTPSSRQPEIRKPKTDVSAPKQVPPGYIAIVWSTSDPNNEDLEYTVALQGEHETKWNVVKEELEAPLYYLDTSNLADGGYYVKITATDTPANPPDRALTVEKLSERFVIDNTAPIISIALNQKQDDESEALLVTVIAQDEVSRLERAEYSLDGGDWTAIFPDDEVTDSRDEKYSIVLSDLTSEEHLLVFRATDKYNNTGVTRFVFSPETALAPEKEAQPEQQPTQTP